MTRRVIEPVVLNAREPAGASRPLGELGAELRTRINRIIGAHADPATGYLDYRAIGETAEFRGFVGLTGGLATGRPEELPTAEAQIAFWANLYNALTLHAIVTLDIQNGVGDVHEFFRRVQYDVGGDRLSLLDIEHGVLRRNRPSRNQPARVFGRGDRRLRWVVTRFDPRVHFALNCGARSCPPVRAYDPRQLDGQLDLATRGFVNADVEIDPAARCLTLSRIFYWYEDDFGDVPGFLLAHLDPGPARDWLAAHRGAVTLVHRAYDWDLNDASVRA
ncbi:MAG: DUF547 domain-containing protein [Candidatus Rokubacteria bacterium]|nr:DUF547 domain-containing protein [Candidatus Rokubacteria bacterium]